MAKYCLIFAWERAHLGLQWIPSYKERVSLKLNFSPFDTEKIYNHILQRRLAFYSGSYLNQLLDPSQYNMYCICIQSYCPVWTTQCGVDSECFMQQCKITVHKQPWHICRYFVHHQLYYFKISSFSWIYETSWNRGWIQAE